MFDSYMMQRDNDMTRMFPGKQGRDWMKNTSATVEGLQGPKYATSMRRLQSVPSVKSIGQTLIHIYMFVFAIKYI
jgi:hypothetical protein